MWKLLHTATWSFVPHIRPRSDSRCRESWSEWQDLNLRPPRPERGALSSPINREQLKLLPDYAVAFTSLSLSGRDPTEYAVNLPRRLGASPIRQSLVVREPARVAACCTAL